MNTKVIHNGHCKYCGAESKQSFCNRQCYLDYVKPTIDWEKQQRNELTDRIVKRTIYIVSKGSIKYDQITPEMIISKRAQLTEKRKRKAARKKKEKIYRACVVCGKEYEAKGNVIVCGDECRHKHELERVRVYYIQVRRNKNMGNGVDKPIVCRYCGASFTPQYNDGRRLYCSATCQKRSERRHRHKNNGSVRRDKAERYGERFKAADIYERDGWICGICHGKVSSKIKYPHPMSASLDHIVPIANGGTHTRDNVQLAHWICNSTVGAGGVKQLLLFG